MGTVSRATAGRNIGHRLLAPSYDPEMHGRVVRIDDKGFGFVQPQGSAEHFYFHRDAGQSENAFRAMLGQPVRFEITATENGPRATGVVLAAESPGSQTRRFVRSGTSRRIPSDSVDM